MKRGMTRARSREWTRALLGAAVVTACALVGGVAPAAPVGTPATPATPPQRVLRVCSDPNNMPFSNDKGEGFENHLAQIIASDLHATVAYTWFPQRRGFIRKTLKAGLCDVVMGVPATFEMVATTKPYYRSGYAFVYGATTPRVRSLDAPELATLRIGVPLVGDDGSNAPPAIALGQRNLIANLHGYSVYGDYSKESPPADAIRALRRGEIDLAIAWGPVAGYYAKTGGPALQVALIPEADAPKGLTFTFDIAMGVRHGDKALATELDGVLARQHARITKLLDEYGVLRR